MLYLGLLLTRLAAFTTGVSETGTVKKGTVFIVAWLDALAGLGPVLGQSLGRRQNLECPQGGSLRFRRCVVEEHDLGEVGRISSDEVRDGTGEGHSPHHDYVVRPKWYRGQHLDVVHKNAQLGSRH
jgi:hypothetical protein